MSCIIQITLTPRLCTFRWWNWKDSQCIIKWRRNRFSLCRTDRRRRYGKTKRL